MERVLEKELMCDQDQAKAYAQADFEVPHGHFISLFQETFADRDRDIGGFALDLGCGPADISIRFARHYPNCIVHGIDGSSAMLAEGRKILTHALDIRDRIELYQVYLPHDAAPRNKYDVIFSNSLLHHLHEPSVLWECIHRYAQEGSFVFIMDLRRPKTVRQAKTLVKFFAEGVPDVLQRDFYHSLLVVSFINNVELLKLRLSGDSPDDNTTLFIELTTSRF